MQLASAEAIDALGLNHSYSFSENPEAPLVYLIHGRAGNTRVMWAFRRCFPEGVSLIAPEAMVPDPQDGGYSWWNIFDTSNRLEHIESAVRRLHRFIDEAESFYQRRPARRLGLGFSQGAALVSVILQTSECFESAGLLSGFVIQISDKLRRPLEGVSVFMAHGSADEVISLEKAEKGKEFLLSHGCKLTWVTDATGHKIGTNGMRALSDWLNQSTR